MQAGHAPAASRQPRCCSPFTVSSAPWDMGRWGLLVSPPLLESGMERVPGMVVVLGWGLLGVRGSSRGLAGAGSRGLVRRCWQMAPAASGGRVCR